MSTEDQKPTARRVLTEADIARDPEMVEKIKHAATSQSGPAMSPQEFQNWLKDFAAR